MSTSSVSAVVTVAVGTSRHDGSKDTVSIRITFDDGTITTWKALGNKFKKGTTRTFEISFEYSGGAIEDVELLSSGKDGIKCTDVQVEISGKPPVSFSMPSFLKCRGSKRAGTWNCGMKLKRKVTEDDSTGCKTCDKESQKKISDFSGASLSSVIVDRALDLDDERYKQLVYGFGKLIMDCSINAAVRFEYDAFCDDGCYDRHGSFSRSPSSYFPGGVEGRLRSDTCQQSTGKAYPCYCVEESGSQIIQNSNEKKSCKGIVRCFDRGHLIPANHLDFDKELIHQSNYMTNILPQVAQMNRGAWLHTEMLIECYRDLYPVRVVGGAV